MQKREDWALPRERIEAFFRSQPDVIAAGENFCFGSCTVQLIPLENHVLGSLQFPRTRVIFDGGETDVQILYRRFFLRFVSAGG